MRTSAAARRYADAAFSVARADGNAQTWLADLARAEEALTEGETADYFHDPNVARESKVRTIQDAFDSMHPHVVNLLKILASQNRLSLLRAISYEFAQLDREARGIEEAEVTVARPLSPDDEARIREQLAQAIGKDIELTTRVDGSILGGVMVRVGDRLVDASVAGRLERLRQNLVV